MNRQPGVTRREREVAALVADGLTNRQIALRLGITHWTVKTHLNNLAAYLSAESRVSIATWYDRTYGSRDAARDVLRELAANDPAGLRDLLSEVFR